MHLTQKAGIGLALLTAGGLAAAPAHAAGGTFLYSTNFAPSLITGTGGFFFTNNITVSNSSSSALAPTQILLASFLERSDVTRPNTVTVSQPFTEDLTISPQGGGGTTITQRFTGNLSGFFNTTQSSLSITPITPQPFTYDFGTSGKYTVSNFTFSQPGPNLSSPGALSANVTFTPGNASPAPEPAEVATLSMIALGLGGLLLRARKRQAQSAE